ncbi:MAG: hypothetical protein P1V97_31295, partial [Planctomycetota bacterium]|nr:hypothetical protein [Planctomycetota bacterium]
GDVRRLGPKTDIYLLGSILFEVLTGEPPHSGPGSVLYQASQGVPPRLENTEEELEKICMRAMSKEPKDRYASVKDFQEALRAFLSHSESRLVSVRAESTFKSCHETIENEKAVLSGKDRDQLYSDFAEVIAGFKQALLLWPENTHAASGEVTARLSYAKAALSFGDIGLAEAQLVRSPEGERRNELIIQIARLQRKQGWTKRTAQSLKWVVGIAVSIGIIAVSIYLKDITAQQTIIVEKADRANQETRLAKLEADRADLKAKVAKEEASIAKRREIIVEEILKKLVYQFRENLSKLPNKEAKEIRRELLRTARKGRVRLLDTYRKKKKTGREYAVNLMELASIWKAESRLSEAVKTQEEALVIFRRLAKADPTTASTQIDLAGSMLNVGLMRKLQGDLNGALNIYEKGLAILRPLAKASATVSLQRNLSIALNNLGDVKELQGNLNGALESYRDSLSILMKLAKANPSNSDLQRSLSFSLVKIGTVKKLKGDVNGALKDYQAALVIARRLAKATWRGEKTPRKSSWSSQRQSKCPYNPVEARQSRSFQCKSSNSFVNFSKWSRRHQRTPRRSQWRS